MGRAAASGNAAVVHWLIVLMHYEPHETGRAASSGNAAIIVTLSSYTLTTDGIESTDYLLFITYLP